MSTRSLTRPLSAVVVALALVLAVSACGGNDDNSSASGATSTTKADEAPNVVAKDFEFTLAKGTVKAGSEVYFQNDGPSIHTMTADDGSFDTGHVDAGKKAEVEAPKTAGTYSFHCEIHPSMTATLTVQ